LIKQIKLYFVGTFFISLFGLITLPILTRFLTLEDYGILALFLVVGPILVNIFSLNLGTATTRFYFDFYKRNYNNFKILNTTNFLSLISILLFGGLIIFLLSDFISDKIFFKKVPSEVLILSYIYGCFAKIYDYLLKIYIIKEDAKNYSVITIFYTAIVFFLSIFLFNYFTASYISRIYALLISIFFIVFIVFILLISEFKFIFSLRYLLKSFKFSLQGFPENILALIGESLDKYFISRLSNLGSLGFYEVAMRVSLTSKTVIDLCLRVWANFFLKKIGNNRKFIIKSYELLVFVIILLTYGLALFSEELLIILTTEKFYDAKYIVPIICLSIMTNHIFSAIAKPQIYYSKKIIASLPSSIVFVFTITFFSYILIPKIGAIGAAISYFLAGLASSIMLLNNAQKLLHLKINKYYLLFIVFLFVLFIIPIYLMFYFELNYLYKFLFKVLLFFLIFAIFFKREFVHTFNKLNIQNVKL
jgi:O-antigen/teichoic acid export membrane protein